MTYKHKFPYALLIILALAAIVTACKPHDEQASAYPNPLQDDLVEVTLDNPGTNSNTTDMLLSAANFDGEHPWVEINNNYPFFTTDDISTKTFETYAELDRLGRCGPTYANVGIDLMPGEDREEIGSVKPSGWTQAKYDFVDGSYLYNRCHLIGFQLTGENANEQNLITGTRYLNIEGMLPFENMVADYVKETKNHVLYRVTPIFQNDNLVADGVLMEGYSVEDEGDGICYCVFCFNVQPGVEIDYKTGESHLAEKDQTATAKPAHYVLNTKTMKFHNSDCPSISTISSNNIDHYVGDRGDIIEMDYKPCGVCKP